MTNLERTNKLVEICKKQANLKWWQIISWVKLERMYNDLRYKESEIF